MTLLLKEEITFPRWDGDPEFDPYGTYKELVLALKYGRSLDAAERAADDEELLIDNDDAFTRKLILKAVDYRRDDVIQFLVETLAPGETLLVDTNSLVSWEDSVEFDVRTTGGCCT